MTEGYDNEGKAQREKCSRKEEKRREVSIIQPYPRIADEVHRFANDSDPSRSTSSSLVQVLDVDRRSLRVVLLRMAIFHAEDANRIPTLSRDSTSLAELVVRKLRAVERRLLDRVLR